MNLVDKVSIVWCLQKQFIYSFLIMSNKLTKRFSIIVTKSWNSRTNCCLVYIHCMHGHGPARHCMNLMTCQLVQTIHDYVTFSWFLKMLNVSHTFFHNFLWMFLYISHVKFTWSIVRDFTAHISHNSTHISQFQISFSQHLMMWKGGHHFTWFSHSDCTLFFTDVWNCMWKTKWKFHMYFTCISHHFFQ